MSDSAQPTLDPERLKKERRTVDFGTDQETDHNHLDRQPGKPPRADDPVSHPTAGVTPPAR